MCSPCTSSKETLSELLGADDWQIVPRAERHWAARKEDVKIDIQYLDDLVGWDYGEYEGLTTPQINIDNDQLGFMRWDIWSDGCQGGE